MEQIPNFLRPNPPVKLSASSMHNNLFIVSFFFPFIQANMSA